MASKKAAPPRCAGRTRGGKACRNRAVPGTDPPRCRVKHGETGRPAKPPDEKLTQDLVDLFEKGNLVETACERVGLARSTFWDWMAKGADDPRGPYGAFSQRVRRARAKAVGTAVEALSKAAEKGDWRAAAWFLERYDPERWARTQQRPVGDRPPERPPAQADQGDGEPAPDPVRPDVSPFDELDAVTDLTAVRQARQG